MVVFKSFQYAIRNEVKQKILHSVKESELIAIRMSVADMNSGKDGYKKTDDKEFVLQGKLYDVVRSKTIGDSVILYCINDIKEEQLFANLDIHVKHYMESNIPIKQKTNTLFKIIVTPAILQKNVAFTQSVSDYEYVFSLSEKLNFIFINILTPPPKRIS